MDQVMNQSRRFTARSIIVIMLTVTIMRTRLPRIIARAVTMKSTNMQAVMGTKSKVPLSMMSLSLALASKKVMIDKRAHKTMVEIAEKRVTIETAVTKGGTTERILEIKILVTTTELTIETRTRHHPIQSLSLVTPTKIKATIPLLWSVV